MFPRFVLAAAYSAAPGLVSVKGEGTTVLAAAEELNGVTRFVDRMASVLDSATMLEAEMEVEGMVLIRLREVAAPVSSNSIIEVGAALAA